MSDSFNYIHNLMWSEFIEYKINNNILHINDIMDFYLYDVGFPAYESHAIDNYNLGSIENDDIWNDILYYTIQNKLNYENEHFYDNNSKINYFILLFGNRINWNITLNNIIINDDNIYYYAEYIFFNNCEDILLITQKLPSYFIEEYYTQFIQEHLFRYQNVPEQTINYIISNHDINYITKQSWIEISKHQTLSKTFVNNYYNYLTDIIITNKNSQLSISIILNIIKRLNKCQLNMFDKSIKERLKPYIVKLWIKKYRKSKKNNIKLVLLKKNIPNIINNIIFKYYY